ncbi:MAG: aromatic amino acid DMT transporter YddG [Sedimentisphaerales bacterium]|nr:aromatic amino acid DMT transporter YddG [Sedimentisphaerales bacterium]
MGQDIKTEYSTLATVGGLFAIILWSTTVAVARSLSEQLGPVTAAAAVYSVSGMVAVIQLLGNSQRTRRILRLPGRYLMGCGLLFLGYMLMIYLAIGWAQDRQQVLEVGLLNYLWPTLTLVLSVVILKNKANWILLPGTLLALTGVFLVVTQGKNISWQSLTGNYVNNPGSYWLALAAAVSWAMYSNLINKWAGGRKEGGVTLFLPVTSIVLIILCCFLDEPRQWSGRTWVESLFLGIATYIGYMLWDNSMRRGNVVLVAASSYLTPLFSTIASCLYLAVVPGARLWIGCSILIFGSIISWKSVTHNSTRATSQASASLCR